MVIFHDTSNDIGSFTKDVVAKLHLSEDKIPNLEPFLFGLVGWLLCKRLQVAIPT